MKKGFTLVELSIVLVIIGLLVGGILVGQSLIDSAKLGSFVREFQQYRVAVDQFESRYRSLPGDTALFDVPTRGTAVANDGLIFDSNSTDNTFTGEVGYFWKHLSDANMIADEYEFDASAGIVAGVNTPELVYDNASVVPIISANNTNHFLVVDYSSKTTNSTGSPETALSAIEALAIDSKIDDGLSITDSFTGVGGFDYKDQMFADGGGTCWETTTPLSGPKNYNTSNPDATCSVFLRYK